MVTILAGFAHGFPCFSFAPIRSPARQWLLLYGGDPANEAAPDVGLLAARLAGAWGCAVLGTLVSWDRTPQPHLTYYTV